MKKQNLTALALALSVATGANAQTDEIEEIRLEEILVTAQKREQNLMDVPVSVNAMAGEKIDDAGLTGIERMADYIPSLNMTQTGIGTTISIRGISSGVNQGFEQSAAQFIDGVHFGRAQLSRAPFLDIERVEVLRGPQSILFGKNSTAGAISITTARPTDEFEGKVSALYEPEHGEQDLRAVVSGPLTDQLSGRLAVLDRSMDGYYENTTLNRDETQEDDQVVRGTLLWQPNSQWDVTLKLEDSSFDREGRNLEAVNPVELPVEGAIPYSTVLAQVTGALSGGQDVYQLDSRHDFKRESNGDYSYNNTRNGMLEVETELGELAFTSVTGYTAYDYEELCDCDFVGVPSINILSMEDYSQWSQEFRIASPQSGTFSYLGGLFYQTSDLDFADAVNVPQGSVLLGALELNGTVPGATGFGGTSTRRNFQQDNDIAAVFFQGTWSVTPDLRVIAGGRYTDEEKTASRRQFHTAPGGGGEVPIGTPADPLNVFYGLFNVEPYETLSETRSESGFTPSLTVQYDLNGTDTVYASYTTGFKSGGFDVRSNSHPDPTVNNAYNFSSGTPQPITGVFEFEDEEVKNYELGGKFSLAGGRAELNAALFYTDFQDLQTSQFDGAFSFNVTNAAEATIQGLELDGRFMATDSLMFTGGLAWIDFEYDDFPTAQCYFGQAPGQSQCDASGKTREFTPEFQGNLSANHTADLSRGLTLTSTLDLIYSDEFYTTPTLDPRMVQDSYVKLNGRIALAGQDDRWELALIGKNLTDEDIVSYANGLPIASVLTQGTGSGYYAFYERPRSIALQGTLRF